MQMKSFEQPTLKKKHWNYRIMCQEYQGEMHYAIHEVHYENETPKSYTENPAALISDDIEGFSELLGFLQVALGKPILWKGDKFPEIYKPTE